MAIRSPEPSKHVEYTTWPKRGDVSISVQQAWLVAEPLPAALACVDADEARYHQPTDTLLLRRDECLVTVLDVGGAADADLRSIVRDTTQAETNR